MFVLSSVNNLEKTEMDKRDGTKKKKAIDGDQKWRLELFRVNTQIGIIVDKGFLCRETSNSFWLFLLKGTFPAWTADGERRRSNP